MVKLFESSGALVGGVGTSSWEEVVIEFWEFADLRAGREFLFRLVAEDDREIGSLKRDLLAGAGNVEASGGSRRW